MKDESGGKSNYICLPNSIRPFIIAFLILFDPGMMARAAETYPVVVVGKEVYNAYESKNTWIVRIPEAQVERIVQTEPKNPLALFVAATRGDEALTKKLLAQGADPNHATDFGQYPIHEAARGGYSSVLDLLLAAGANVDVRINANGPNSPNQWTPLHFAAYGGYLDIAKKLIAKSADVNAKDYWGKTPLYYASAQHHEALVALLVQSGALSK